MAAIFRTSLLPGSIPGSVARIELYIFAIAVNLLPTLTEIAPVYPRLTRTPHARPRRACRTMILYSRSHPSSPFARPSHAARRHLVNSQHLPAVVQLLQPDGRQLPDGFV